jgi:hypothetical protein
VAAEVDRIRAELRDEPTEPVIAANSWAVPGELAFYCAGHPTVHSLGPALGDRRSQYDFWRPNPFWDEKEFLGRTMIYVGEVNPLLYLAFDRLEETRVVTCREHGEPIASWKVTVCRGYRGISWRTMLGKIPN